MRHRLGFALVLLLAVSLFPGCIGQRALRVQITRDGELILQTAYGVSDRLNAAAIWRSLEGKSFKTVDTLKPETDDPQKAVVKGKIRIVILHVDREIASAQVDEIRLVRVPGSNDQWQLAPDEVRRTGQAAGL